MTVKTQSDESRVTHGVKELLAEANAAVRTITVVVLTVLMIIGGITVIAVWDQSYRRAC